MTTKVALATPERVKKFAKMDDYLCDIIDRVRKDTDGMDEQEIYDYIEENFNSEFAEVPDIDIDWFYVINYVMEYQLNNYSELLLETPLDKVVVWNTFVYIRVREIEL